jgi:hypothetical protein
VPKISMQRKEKSEKSNPKGVKKSKKKRTLLFKQQKKKRK